VTEEIKLPCYEFTIRVEPTFIVENTETQEMILQIVSTCQHWIFTNRLTTEASIPPEVSNQLLKDKQSLDKWTKELAQAIQRSSIVPDQLMVAANMAVNMTCVAISNAAGLSSVELGREIDSHIRMLKEDIKENLGVRSGPIKKNHITKTRDIEAFSKRIDLAVQKLRDGNERVSKAAIAETLYMGRGEVGNKRSTRTQSLNNKLKHLGLDLKIVKGVPQLEVK
jgi:hypothetical protein